MPNAPGNRYNATERQWVKNLLAKLTPDERLEYERRCEAYPYRHRTGKLFDGVKGAIAEQVRLDYRTGKVHA